MAKRRRAKRRRTKRAVAALIFASAIVAGGVWIAWRVSQGESHSSAFRFPTPGGEGTEGEGVEIEPAERARLESVLERIESANEEKRPASQ